VGRGVPINAFLSLDNINNYQGKQSLPFSINHNNPDCHVEMA
jgi:hypothetical protein